MGKADISIQSDITGVVNFALQQNRIPVVREISLYHAGTEPLEDVTLRITTTPEISIPYESVLRHLPGGQAVVVRNIPLLLNADVLAGLTERITGVLRISLCKNDEELSSHTKEIVALAYDEWHGSVYFPELLAAFVTPNHPEVTKINARASELLGMWTGNQSLNAYLSRSPDRVKKQVAAVYGALQEQNIVYSVPPASFEMMGQRVRLCDAIMQQHMGTCLDVALFYASCLEGMGLCPLLLLQKGHVFLGVWLEDMSFPESVSDDPALITKRVSEDIGEITVVECTALTAGKDISFGEAERAAIRSLQGIDALEYIIDVHRARLSGVRPLPLRVRTEQGWVVAFDKRDVSELTAAPEAMRDAVSVTEGAAAPVTKRMQWERKLLDLGLRNTLINMRLSRNLVPIFSSSLSDLEDALASGAEFGIMPRPVEWAQQGKSAEDFEDICDVGPYSQLIQAEFDNKRLRSPLTEGDLSRVIVNLYRTSKTSLEENGSNTLYLSCGLLRWFETKASQKARYAPLVLLPVEIIRKSAAKGYVVRLRDEEVQMNITLLEMLKQDFGIVISGLDPLPLDENGVNMREVFAVMRHAVMAQPRWDVLESSFLGIFSFSQFVMWNDMRNRYQDLETNKVVKSLMAGSLQWEAGDMRIGDRVPEGDVYLPMAADASQLFAIESAAKGESFVLHGPPGTGKSQTITALIANALAQGQTVLFVAEKMAALSVVQKRLEHLGIGPFCLELHSNKSRKKDVLEQLRAATEVRGARAAETYERVAERTAALRAELNAYARGLHAPRRAGLSLYDMVNLYEANRWANGAIRFEKGFAEALQADDLREKELLLERLTAAAKAVGHPHGHKLRAVGRADYSQQVRAELPNTVGGYRASVAGAETWGRQLSAWLQVDPPRAKAGWERLAHVAAELKRWEAIPRAWAQKDPIPAYLEGVRTFVRHAQKAEAAKRALGGAWTPDFLQQDGEALEAEWKTASAKWFLPKALGQNQIAKRLRPFAAGAVQKTAVPGVLALLAEYRRESRAADAWLCRDADGVATLYAGENTDWDRIIRLCAEAEESGQALRALTGSDHTRLRFAADREGFAVIDSFAAAWREFRDAQARLGALLAVDFDSYGVSDWMAAQGAVGADIIGHADALREWMVWNGMARDARGAGLGHVVDSYEAGLDHAAVLPSYRKALYAALIVAAVESDETLNRFSGAVFDEKIEQFKRIDRELTELTRREIFCRLAAKVPDFSREAAQSSELGILQRAIRSGGRGLSIRKLFEQIPNLLPRLCPCMLMSPISAAQYLDPKRPPFDVVVFDEASQLPTCKAVGALARGREAIVVGDPNQMPPTSFFSGGTVDEENLDTEDLESILDDCLALSMPQTHLLWHYRSRHESLIAFSNSQFYENKLYTFPSVNDRESRVRLVPAGGCFDRGKSRQNRVEAEMVVAELIRRYKDPALNKYSVGVVTFNISQQNLIDDLFTEACKSDGGMEAWAYESEEPLFVKNLENVQGDERDVILFSIGFGPDREGKIFMNFGPLNREGGWRRLNVAVSRARYDMVVFSSLQPDQINLSKTNARGVAALKAFLEYARSGQVLAEETASLPKSAQQAGVAGSICEFLNAAGYETQRSVGHSEYRIDVGVVDPDHPDRYLLGVLLDGPLYGGAKTTRDRELAQTSVLHGLGWETHRVWTMDWWDNSQKEKDKLLARLKALRSAAAQRPAAEEHAPAAAPEGEVVRNENTRVMGDYQPAPPAGRPHVAAPRESVYLAANLPNEPISADDYILPEYTRKVADRFRLVLRAEAPISEALLVKRVLQSCGIARAGNRVQARNTGILQGLGVRYTEWKDQKFYWNDGQDPSAYRGFRATGEGPHKRDARDVPTEEAANAVCAVLEEQIGLPQEDLIRETAKKLGYIRTGPLVVETIERGMDHLKQKSRIARSDNGYVTLR
ncbi:MAG: DUF3320 domain-containing protein [Oscillospiraceae bacterium]|jgi:hypothetical protein|nr:DUF3320 domain-containing protein [Oscillospiraceae bacterium]